MKEFLLIENDKCYRKAGYVSPRKPMRISLGRERWYLENNIYSRGQSFLAEKIQQLLGEDIFLKSWRKTYAAELGSEETLDTWVASTADFGTLVHELVGQDVAAQNIPVINKEGKAVTRYLTDKEISSSIVAFKTKYNLSELAAFKAAVTATKAVLSFRKFIDDYQLDIFSMEEMCTDPSIRTTTPIDIFGVGKVKERGKEKDVIILANMKTSESSGSYHQWQCAIEYRCALATLNLKKWLDLGYEVRVMTVRPKDWKYASGATYEVNDYTDFATGERARKTIDSAFTMLDQNGKYDKPSQVYPSLLAGGGFELKNMYE